MPSNATYVKYTSYSSLQLRTHLHLHQLINLSTTLTIESYPPLERFFSPEATWFSTPHSQDLLWPPMLAFIPWSGPQITLTKPHPPPRSLSAHLSSRTLPGTTWSTSRIRTFSSLQGIHRARDTNCCERKEHVAMRTDTIIGIVRETIAPKMNPRTPLSSSLWPFLWPCLVI